MAYQAACAAPSTDARHPRAQIELLFSWLKADLKRETRVTAATLVTAVYQSACSKHSLARMTRRLR